MPEQVFDLPTIKEFAKITQKPDGSVVFHDAILFSEGEWHAHNMPRPITFLMEHIMPSLKMWGGLNIWAGHRDLNGWHNPITSIGVTANQRIDGPHVRGDIIAHGKTQASKDAIAMWKAGKLPDLSAELGSRETREGDKLIAKDLHPIGIAWVQQGACTTCKVTHLSLSTHKTQAGSQTAGAAGSEKITGGGHMADEDKMKELQADLDVAKAEIKALSNCKDNATKELAQTQSKHEAKVKELTKALEDKGEKVKVDRIKELEAQVKELENPEGKIKELAEAKKELEAKTGREVKELTTRIKGLENKASPKSRRFAEGGEGEGETKELHSNFARSKGGDMELKVV